MWHDPRPAPVATKMQICSRNSYPLQFLQPLACVAGVERGRVQGKREKGRGYFLRPSLPPLSLPFLRLPRRLLAVAYSSHYFPSESVNLFRTLNRATIGHLGEGGKDKIAHPSPTPGALPVVLAPSLYLGFRLTPGRYFVKWRPTMIKCVRIQKQDIHGRLHNHSLFTSLESFKIWPCELEN